MLLLLTIIARAAEPEARPVQFEAVAHDIEESHPLDHACCQGESARLGRTRRADELHYYNGLAEVVVRGQPLSPFMTAVAARSHSERVQEATAASGAWDDLGSVGVADLHAHVFSDLGFGRRVVVATELACDGEHHGLRWGITRNLVLASPEVLTDPMMGQLVRHCPSPDLPAFQSWTHEQYRLDDLRAAHEARSTPLQIVVVSAVNAQILCAISRGRTPDVEGPLALGRDPRAAFDCGDDVNIHRQIAAIWDTTLREPWFDVVVSPEGARAAIAAGHLAVLIGVEGSDFLDSTRYGGIADARLVRRCNRGRRSVGARDDRDPCSVAAREVERHLYDLGVSVVVPIHEWSNGLGGASVQNSGLFQPTARLRHVASRTDEESFLAIGGRFLWFNKRYSRGRIWNWPMPLEEATDTYDQRPYFRTREGLTPYGRALMWELVDGTLGGQEEIYAPFLDLTHFSDHTFADLQSLIGDRTARVLVSHGVPRALTVRGSASLEFPVSTDKYRFTLQKGGVVGIQTSNDVLVPPGGGAARGVVCPGSIESIRYGLDFLYGLGARGLAFGTDLNGGALGVAPSLGPHACWGAHTTPAQVQFGRVYSCLQAAKQADPPTAARDAFEHVGLASIGELPGMLAALPVDEQKPTPQEDAVTDALNWGAASLVHTWHEPGSTWTASAGPRPPVSSPAAIPLVRSVDSPASTELTVTDLTASAAAACGVDAWFPNHARLSVTLRRDGDEVTWTAKPSKVGAGAPPGVAAGTKSAGEVAIDPQLLGVRYNGIFIPYDAELEPGNEIGTIPATRAELRVRFRHAKGDKCIDPGDESSSPSPDRPE